MDGLKRAVAVTVGEKHSLALQRWSATQLAGLQRVPWLAHLAAPGGDPDAAVIGSPGADDDGLYNRAADSLATPRGDIESEPSGLSMAHSLASPDRLVQNVPPCRRAACAATLRVTCCKP